MWSHLDIPGVLVQYAALLANLIKAGRLPLLLAASLLLVVDEPVNLPCLGVDDNLVAVLDERDGATVNSLRDDMAYTTSCTVSLIRR